MELEVPEDCVGVLVLCDASVQLVGPAIVAGLSEPHQVGEGGDGHSCEEPSEGAHGLLSERGRIEPGAG